jgi:hypothetical protein
MEVAPAETCSSIEPTKAIASADDTAFFKFAIGDISLDPPVVPSIFTETLTVGGSEIWVAGQLIEGEAISAGADGDNLFFNDIRIPLVPEMPTDSAFTTRREHIYSNVPRYNELRASGLAASEAMRRFKAELSQVFNDAHAAFLAGGHQAAYQILQSSPLLEAVTRVGDGRFSLKCVGWRGRIRHDCRAVETVVDSVGQKARNMQVARHLVETVKDRLADGVPRVITIKNGLGMDVWEGEPARQISQQLRYARSGGPLENLPPGPLSMHDPVLQQAATSGRANKP